MQSTYRFTLANDAFFFQNDQQTQVWIHQNLKEQVSCCC